MIFNFKETQSKFELFAKKEDIRKNYSDWTNFFEEPNGFYAYIIEDNEPKKINTVPVSIEPDKMVSIHFSALGKSNIENIELVFYNTDGKILTREIELKYRDFEIGDLHVGGYYFEDKIDYVSGEYYLNIKNRSLNTEIFVDLLKYEISTKTIEDVFFGDRYELQFYNITDDIFKKLIVSDKRDDSFRVELYMNNLVSDGISLSINKETNIYTLIIDSVSKDYEIEII